MYIIKLKKIETYISIFKQRFEKIIESIRLKNFIDLLLKIKISINNDNYYINISSLLTFKDFNEYIYIKHIFLDIHCYIYYNNIDEIKKIFNEIININNYKLILCQSNDINYIQEILLYIIFNNHIEYKKIYILLQYIILDLKNYSLLCNNIYLFDNFIINIYNNYIYKFIEDINIQYYYKIHQLYHLYDIIYFIQYNYRKHLRYIKNKKKNFYINVIKEIEYLPEKKNFNGGYIYNKYKEKFNNRISLNPP